MGIFPLCLKLIVNVSQEESAEIFLLSNIILSPAARSTSHAAKPVTPKKRLAKKPKKYFFINPPNKLTLLFFIDHYLS